MDFQGGLKFALSGFSSEDALTAKAIITSQGGTVLSGVHLHPDSNCLLVKKLSRTENVLSALARGLPILDYNEALKVGFFKLSKYQQNSLLDLDWGSKDQKQEQVIFKSFKDLDVMFMTATTFVSDQGAQLHCQARKKAAICRLESWVIFKRSEESSNLRKDSSVSLRLITFQQVLFDLAEYFSLLEMLTLS
jgi:hypothetical protein